MEEYCEEVPLACWASDKSAERPKETVDGASMAVIHETLRGRE
jgi:hypothetical protein